MSCKWQYSCCFQDVSKQHTASLFSYNIAFSPDISLKCRWCNYMIILTMLQCRRILILFLSECSDFHLVFNLSRVVHAFPRHMLTLLSVEEILLTKYVNWSTNFRNLLFDEEMAPSCFKCGIRWDTSTGWLWYLGKH